MLYKTIFTCISAIFLVGCSQNVTTPKVSKLTQTQNTKYTVKTYQNTLEYQDTPRQNLKMPDVLEKNAYGIEVTPELKTAYDNYLLGDGTKALQALEKAQKDKTDDSLYQWQISFLKVKVYSMMGLDADALEELEKCEKFELLAFNHNLNSIALQGEINVMEGNSFLAAKNFYTVLNAIGEWELPTSYSMPPSNIKELVAITTAQLRALTGLGASYAMEDNYKKAYFWAQEAEKRFNAVQYVSNHFLYGMYLKTHLDTYYGRALNMAILASSILATTGDLILANPYYEKALEFFDSIGYKKGKIITLALKAKALLYKERYQESFEVADEAIQAALKNNMYDFIWRIEMLKGFALLKQEKIAKAKIAFQNAANVVDLVSGELQSDFAKRRFGIGKSDITYELMQIAFQENNLAELFLHVEQGKARAFVDVMRNKIINQSNFSPILSKIQNLDKEIKLLLVKNNLQPTPQSLEDEKVLRKKRKVLEQELFKTSPKSSSIVSSLSYSLQDVQQKLLDDEAIIYFLPVKDYENLQYLLIEKKKVSLLEYGLTSKDLSYILNDYLISLKTYYEDKNNQKSTNLSELKNQISLEQIKQKRLYIVGSGTTAYIPWYALNADKSISILPSVSTLFFQHEITTLENNIVVGDPYFADKMPQLQGARKEALELAKYYNTKPLLYKEATYTNIQKALQKGTNILHLATHGLFDYNNPMNSSIFLCENDDLYTWSAKDIVNSQIKSNLVVLSACKTGLGKNIEGDDLLGLPRSLFLSGSKAILSSLWPVDDEKTQSFMLEFHKFAQNGKYADALQKTATLFQEKGYDVSTYGAFILYGTDLK